MIQSMTESEGSILFIPEGGNYCSVPFCLLMGARCAAGMADTHAEASSSSPPAPDQWKRAGSSEVQGGVQAGAGGLFLGHP